MMWPVSSANAGAANSAADAAQRNPGASAAVPIGGVSPCGDFSSSPSVARQPPRVAGWPGRAELASRNRHFPADPWEEGAEAKGSWPEGALAAVKGSGQKNSQDQQGRQGRPRGGLPALVRGLSAGRPARPDAEKDAIADLPDLPAEYRDGLLELKRRCAVQLHGQQAQAAIQQGVDLSLMLIDGVATGRLPPRTSNEISGDVCATLARARLALPGTLAGLHRGMLNAAPPAASADGRMAPVSAPVSDFALLALPLMHQTRRTSRALLNLSGDAQGAPVASRDFRDLFSGPSS